jgi:hypothetical protein
MRMPRLSFKIIGCALACFLTFGLAAACVCFIAFFSDDTPKIFEVGSPSKAGSAIFVSESTMTDNSLHLYVRDPAKSGHAAIYIGVVDDSESTEATSFEQAFWSQDGSLIIVNLRSYKNGNTPTVTIFGAGYDLRRHKKLTAADARSLLKSRGGQGQEIILGSFRRLGWWESF